uniref:Uncharacterized protein n=1 Tax=Cannabis sativa TaxID=3483 RepID=A0A803RAC5_CANSA
MGCGNLRYSNDQLIGSWSWVVDNDIVAIILLIILTGGVMSVLALSRRGVFIITPVGEVGEDVVAWCRMEIVRLMI